MVGDWLKWRIERAGTFRKALREKDHLILIAEAGAQIVGVLHMLFYLDIVHGGLNSHILLLYVREGVEMHVDTIFEDAEVLQEAWFQRPWDNA